LQRLRSPTFDIREIFGAIRFSTFSTQSAQSGHLSKRQRQLNANSRRSSASEGWPHSTHPRGGVNLSVRVKYFSCGNEVDDFVLGVEGVDDGVQARLTHLGPPLTCED
jgi:hypothetical protein